MGTTGSTGAVGAVGPTGLSGGGGGSSFPAGDVVLSGNITTYASPAGITGTTGTSSYGLYTTNPNSNHAISSASLGFYTDTVNGSNSTLALKATDNAGLNARIGQVYMQQPTGLFFSVPSNIGYRFYIGSAVPLQIDNSSNIFFNGSTSPKV
jgi:hypothetical protein